MNSRKIVHFLYLFVLIVFGIVLRLPNLNFPSIGYHNMKENEYISIARNMEKTGNLFRRNVDFYHTFDRVKGETFNLYPQVPFVSYQIVLGDKLFGRNLWFPRFFNILFFIGAVLIAYFFIGELTGDNTYNLPAAGLLTIMPIAVFFSRNLQPEPIAFFFMLLSSIFWIRFFKTLRLKYLTGGSIAAAFVIASKLSFVLPLFPLVFLFPFKQYKKTRNPASIFRDGLIFLSPFIALFIFWFILDQLKIRGSIEGRVNLLSLFRLDYWLKYGKIIWDYTVGENYGLLFFLLFLCGVLLSWVNLFRDRTLLASYIRGSTAAALLYFSIFSDYLNQHSYYQFPFILFVALSILYALFWISRIVFFKLDFSKQKIVYGILFIICVLFSYQPIKRSIEAAYMTIFFGEDVAGGYIKEHTSPEDKFFINTFCQGFGVCVYADRKCGWPGSFEKFVRIENKEKIKYIVFYPFGFISRIKDKKLRNYIFSSYSICYIGGMAKGKKFIPQFVILRKGGRFDMNKFLKDNNSASLLKIYSTIRGKIPFFVIGK